MRAFFLFYGMVNWYGIGADAVQLSQSQPDKEGGGPPDPEEA